MDALDFIRVFDESLDEVAHEDEHGEDAILTIRAVRMILAIARDKVASVSHSA